jgi:ribosomal protein S8
VTGSMGIHMLTKSQIANSIKVTEEDVLELKSTTIDETALDVMMRYGYQENSIVGLQKKSIFFSEISFILIQLTDKMLQTRLK